MKIEKYLKIENLGRVLVESWSNQKKLDSTTSNAHLGDVCVVKNGAGRVGRVFSPYSLYVKSFFYFIFFPHIKIEKRLDQLDQYYFKGFQPP